MSEKGCASQAELSRIRCQIAGVAHAGITPRIAESGHVAASRAACLPAAPTTPAAAETPAKSAASPTEPAAAWSATTWSAGTGARSAAGPRGDLRLSITARRSQRLPLLRVHPRRPARPFRRLQIAPRRDRRSRTNRSVAACRDRSYAAVHDVCVGGLAQVGIGAAVHVGAGALLLAGLIHIQALESIVLAKGLAQGRPVVTRSAT